MLDENRFEIATEDTANMISDALIDFAEEIRKNPKKIYDIEWDWTEVSGKEKLSIESLNITFK